MTGVEYTNRLIKNINSTANNRNGLLNPFEQIKMIGLSGKDILKDFNKALEVWSVDSHLDIFSQFINSNETLVNHKKGNKIEISIWQKDITKNREKIGKVIQEILNNKGLVDLHSGKAISEYMIEQLNWINQRASE